MNTKGVRTIKQIQVDLAHLFTKKAVLFVVRFSLESKWKFKNSSQYTQLYQK